MHNFTICVYSFNGHQNNLVPLLKSIRKFVSLDAEIVLVWDDYVRWYPINFDEIRCNSNCEFRVVKHSEIYNWSVAISEWGWVKQQLAKLLCFSYVQTSYCWICDGDIEIVSNVNLFSIDNRPYLHFTDQEISRSIGYYDFMKRFFNLTVRKNVICNGGGNAVFDKIIIEHMLDFCLSYNAKNLIQCVESVIRPGGSGNNQGNLYPFSEFETYGNYVLSHFPQRIELCKPNWNSNLYKNTDACINII